MNPGFPVILVLWNHAFCDFVFLEIWVLKCLGFMVSETLKFTVLQFLTFRFLAFCESLISLILISWSCAFLDWWLLWNLDFWNSCFSEFLLCWILNLPNSVFPRFLNFWIFGFLDSSNSKLRSSSSLGWKGKTWKEARAECHHKGRGHADFQEIQKAATPWALCWFENDTFSSAEEAEEKN